MGDRKAFTDDEARQFARACKVLARAMTRGQRLSSAELMERAGMREVSLRPMHAFTQGNYRALSSHSLTDLDSDQIAFFIGKVGDDLSMDAILSLDQQGIAMLEWSRFEPLITVHDACARLGLSRSRVYQLVDSGAIFSLDVLGRTLLDPASVAAYKPRQ